MMTAASLRHACGRHHQHSRKHARFTHANTQLACTLARVCCRPHPLAAPAPCSPLTGPAAARPAPRQFGNGCAPPSLAPAGRGGAGRCRGSCKRAWCVQRAGKCGQAPGHVLHAGAPTAPASPRFKKDDVACLQADLRHAFKNARFGAFNSAQYCATACATCLLHQLIRVWRHRHLVGRKRRRLHARKARRRRGAVGAADRRICRRRRSQQTRGACRRRFIPAAARFASGRRRLAAGPRRRGAVRAGRRSVPAVPARRRAGGCAARCRIPSAAAAAGRGRGVPVAARRGVRGAGGGVPTRSNGGRRRNLVPLAAWPLAAGKGAKAEALGGLESAHMF